MTSSCGPVLSPGEPVPQARAVGPLHTCRVQRAQQPAAGERQPRAGQHQPPVTAPGSVRGRRPPVCLAKLQHVAAGVPALHWHHAVTPPFHAMAAWGLRVASQEAGAVGLVTQSQAQGGDEEVPGLMLLLHEAAGAQAQGVAHGAQHGEEPNVRPPRRARAWVLRQGRRLF